MTNMRFSIESCTLLARALEVRWDDGRSSTFHYVWLRDNCRCRVCGDKTGGHRYLELNEIAMNVAPQTAGVDERGALVVTWQAEGHRSHFGAAWLRAHCYTDSARSERRARSVIWGASIADCLPTSSYGEMCADPLARLAMLQCLQDYGFVVVRGLPVDRAAIERLAELIGFIRRTHYGRIFDLVSTPEERILAHTSHAIRPHNDELFRDPPPGILIMHCLAPSADGGGESVLVDGLQLAETLRERAPAAFALLSTVPISHRWFLCDDVDDVALQARWRTFELDYDGQVVAVRINERTMAPFDVPEEIVEPLYDALQTLLALAYRPRAGARFRLEAGDAVVFDNHRVLHARTGFRGARHLRQCHVDRDEVFSRMRVLEHRVHGSYGGWSWAPSTGDSSR